MSSLNGSMSNSRRLDNVISSSKIKRFDNGVSSKLVGTHKYTFPYALFTEKESQGTSLGNTSNTTTYVRNLNTEESFGEQTFAVLDSKGTIRVQPGTYHVYGYCAAYGQFTTSQAQITNADTGDILIHGVNIAGAENGSYDEYNSDATVSGIIRISGTTRVQLQQYVVTGHTTGLGRAINISNKPEVFSALEIWKL